jgi:hypothetical protein
MDFAAFFGGQCYWTKSSHLHQFGRYFTARKNPHQRVGTHMHGPCSGGEATSGLYADTGNQTGSSRPH